MNMLLHACCGPCATYSTLSFAEEGIRPTLYYSNPNIHPYKEWKLRRDNLVKLAEERNIPLWVDDDYELEPFLQQALALGADRCLHCYRIRLEKAAQKANEEGFTAFSTTLLISPYQRHEDIKIIGTELAEKYGIQFLYRDLRPGFRESQQMARDLELYRQGYCGCILSERDRYYRPKSNKKEEKSHGNDG